jgi:predicted RNA-binding protein associated with RNAse of E/G family
MQCREKYYNCGMVFTTGSVFQERKEIHARSVVCEMKCNLIIIEVGYKMVMFQKAHWKHGVTLSILTLFKTIGRKMSRSLTK